MEGVQLMKPRRVLSFDIRARPELEDQLDRALAAGHKLKGIIEQGLEYVLDKLAPATAELAQEKKRALAKQLGITEEEVETRALLKFTALHRENKKTKADLRP